ncbi:MAG: hypothetical protein GX488_05950 [Clostridiales bacterium]|nr:hypothetical protein [Clostridiales bacterium]
MCNPRISVKESKNYIGTEDHSAGFRLGSIIAVNWRRGIKKSSARRLPVPRPAAENGLQKRLFAQVLELLHARWLILKKGTIVDSTIIAAPSSTKDH